MEGVVTEAEKPTAEQTEQQTIADTTQGPPEPVGKRDAVKADTVPEPEDGSADQGSKKK